MTPTNSASGSTFNGLHTEGVRASHGKDVITSARLCQACGTTGILALRGRMPVAGAQGPWNGRRTAARGGATVRTHIAGRLRASSTAQERPAGNSGKPSRLRTYAYRLLVDRIPAYSRRTGEKVGASADLQ